MSRLSDKLIFRAKDLRKNQTEVEKLLWYHLRDRRLCGYKFRRQVPISNYIADFICIDKNLIVELDGSQHLEAVEYDNLRTKKLNMLGFKVLRYWNNDILSKPKLVLQNIAEYLNVT